MILFLSILFLSAITHSTGDVSNQIGNDAEHFEVFADALKVMKLVLRKCWNKAISERDKSDVIFGLQDCLKRVGLAALDKATQEEVIDLPFGAKLVKTMVTSRNATIHRSSKLLSPDDWKELAIEKVFGLLRSHALKLPLLYRFGAVGTPQENFEVGRRRRKNQDNILVFGVMAMLIIAIPLGFQFLAVLGGKALLLAKMALILTSIQGLKKIATSDVNYGLYHNSRRPWSYDRKWQNQYPEPHAHSDGYDTMDQELDPLYHLKPRVSFLHNE